MSAAGHGAEWTLLDQRIGVWHLLERGGDLCQAVDGARLRDDVWAAIEGRRHRDAQVP